GPGKPVVRGGQRGRLRRGGGWWVLSGESSTRSIVPRSFVRRSFVPRSEARGEGTRLQAGRGRPDGPGKPVVRGQRGRLRRSGGWWVVGGESSCRGIVPRSLVRRSFVPRRGARGGGTRPQAGRGRPEGRGHAVGRGQRGRLRRSGGF